MTITFSEAVSGFSLDDLSSPNGVLSNWSGEKVNGDGTVSSGNVRLVYDPETTLEGKHILLVEDIVDSGRTLAKLVTLLAGRKPKSIEICALLHKRIATELQHDVRFVGFDAPNEFLVGYGLDHAENFRHLPYVASLR